MTNKTDLEQIIKAAAFAAHKHKDQRRKDVEASPFINHPLALAHILSSEGAVYDIVVLISALLHDTVEDTNTTLEELEREFGSEVASVVAEVTDDKTLAKDERKRLQVVKAASKSERAKLVKLADKISNLRDIASSPPASWTTERREAYFHWALEVVEGLRGVSLPLDRAFDTAYAQGLRAISDAASDVNLAQPARSWVAGNARGPSKCGQ